MSERGRHWLQGRANAFYDAAMIVRRLADRTIIARSKLKEAAAAIETLHTKALNRIADLPAEVDDNAYTLAAIADALGTDERGKGLIEVATSAHEAEVRLAALYTMLQAPPTYSRPEFPHKLEKTNG